MNWAGWSLILALSSEFSAASGAPGAPPPVHVWQRWEQALTSARPHANPYADVILRVTYTGPGGETIRAYGFWDGGDTYRIRCAFPAPGTWKWRTECSDAADAGLHARQGAVRVVPYAGVNPLYRHGFLRVSANRRYLTHADGTPFLWMGDTAWAGPMRATAEEWQTYIQDRVSKRFSVVQVGPASRWAGSTDAQGNPPFLGEGLARWNPAYWQGFEEKVRAANEAGLVVLLVGVMEPVSRYPGSAEACLFARNITARLFGSFVIFSPSFDSPDMPLGDEVGRAIRDATSVHLITQHPGTPSGQATPTFSERYYDQAYLDFCGVQTGHNGGRRERCARQAVSWNLHEYRREPHKPVINLEAMYDAHGESGWTADDARALGWLSWLSGSLGYTYGAGDVPPKVPTGHGAVWRWHSNPADEDDWRKALQWESALQMRTMRDFFAALEWWRLAPAPEGILDQPEDPRRWKALARNAAGDFAVAYLPPETFLRLEMKAFPAPMRARWFDPVRGRWAEGETLVSNTEGHPFTPPGAGDWVLLLRR